MEEIIIKEPQTDEEVLGEYIESKNREVEMNNEEVSNLKKLSGKELADKLLGATRYDEGISDLLNEENTDSNSFRASESFGKTNIEDLIKQEGSFIKTEGLTGKPKQENSDEILKSYNNKPKFPWEVPHMVVDGDKRDNKEETTDELKNSNKNSAPYVTENTGIFSSIIRDAGIGGNTKEVKDEINSKKIDKEISTINPNRWAESTGTAMLFDETDPKVARLVKGSVNNSRKPIKGETYKNKSVTKKEIAFYATIAIAITTAGFTGKAIVDHNDHMDVVVEKYNDLLDEKMNIMNEYNRITDKELDEFKDYHSQTDDEIIENYKKSLNTLDSSEYTFFTEERKDNSAKENGFYKPDIENKYTEKDFDAINDATNQEIIRFLDETDGTKGK